MRLTLLLSLCCAALGAPEVAFPLRASGRDVVDRNGKRVKLSCVAWIGAHTKIFVPNGLSKRSPQQIAARISEMGFNCVRMPYCTEGFVHNPIIKPVYISKLSDPSNKTALQVLDEVVAALTAHNILTILNNHNTNAGWCCDILDRSGVWYNDQYPESDWISSLRDLSKRYKDNPYVAGFDIRNEPRAALQTGEYPVWADTKTFWPLTFVDWREAAERGAAAVLEHKPDALIIVELLNHGQYLCAFQVRDFPLRVPKERVIWSPHEFHWFSNGVNWWQDVCRDELRSTPALLGGLILGIAMPLYDNFLTKEMVALACACICLLIIRLSTSFKVPCGRILMPISIVVSIVFLLALTAWPVVESMSIDTYEKFAKSRDLVWGHFVLDNTGPLWIGEFGESNPSEWWNWTMKYMRERDLDFSYWALDSDFYPPEAVENGDHIKERGGQDDVYGLLSPDYNTVRHDWKLLDLQALMDPNHDRTWTSTQGDHGTPKKEEL